MADESDEDKNNEISLEMMRKRITELIETSGTCLSLPSLDSELHEIPEELFTPFSAAVLGLIQELDVDFNDFVSLPGNLGRLKGLLKLSAEGNKLATLPSSVGDLVSLKELRINENQIRELPSTFSRLRNLRVLSLVANELCCLAAEIVEGLPLLAELYLDENRLSSLPENFGTLKSMQILELSENQLTSLPDSFGELFQLQVLNLNRNSLSELPGSFGELSQLINVDLSDNNISALPEKFRSAAVIEHLYLDNNIIGTLPEWSGRLSKIINLSFNDNKLQGCPLSESFPESSKSTLKKLEAGGNSMSNLPEYFGELVCLEELHLGSTICELERRNFQNGNWMKQLPERFGQLKALRKLHLDENQLISLPDSFGNLAHLTWLDLGQNLLSCLPDSFCDLQLLEYCQLSKNQLVCLPLNFGKLTKLVDLRLDQNLLEELPDSCSNLQVLHTLDLFNNKIKEVPRWLSKLSSLKRLDLDHNKLKLKLKDVPHLVSKGSEYASRDPNLKDNWRGKSREDKIKAEVVVIPGDDTSLDDEEEENGPAVYSENILAAAMRRGLSIWKIHSGPDERRVQPTDDINPAEFVFNVFEDNVPDDLAAKNTGFFVNLKQETKDDRDEIAECEEDWDKEFEESRECVDNVEHSFSAVGVEVSEVELEKRNTFLSLLSSYPPASQAFTQTATYNSLAFCHSSKNYDNNNLYNTRDSVQQAIFIQGQFDDAD